MHIWHRCSGPAPDVLEPARYIQRCTSSCNPAPTAFPGNVPGITLHPPDPRAVRVPGCCECERLSYQGCPGCCPCSVLDARTHLTAHPSETFVQEASALVQSTHNLASVELLRCEQVK